MGIIWEQPLKPPTSVMLLCALMFVCSMLVMTIYVQRSHLVPNPEISKTWEKILKGLSGIELCAVETGNLKSHRETPFEYVDVSSVHGLMQPRLNTVSMSVNANLKLIRELTRLPKGIIAVTGELPIEGWGRLCYAARNQRAFVNVSFILPDNLTQSEDREVCVILSGPIAVVPLSRPAAICIPPLTSMNYTKLVTLKGRSGSAVSSGENCDQGSVLQMNYSHQTDHLIYPSPVEKSRIARNLQIASGAILLSCFLFVVSKFCCQRRYVIVQQDDSALLFSDRDPTFHNA